MTIQKITGFGKREMQLLFALEQKSNYLFTTQQAKNLLATSDASVKNVLKRLKQKHRIIRIEKGIYLFAPLKSGVKGNWTENAFELAPALAKTNDYYIGFASAMNYWGMTEQLPTTIWIALKKQKKQVNAVQAKFIFIKKKKLGEKTVIEINNTKVNVSSIEQTIIDGLIFPQHCFGIKGVAQAIYFSRKKIDWLKLKALVDNEKNIVRRRLGFLLDLLELNKQAKTFESKFSGVQWLDSTEKKQVLMYSKKWGLKINARTNDLLEFKKGF